MRSDLIDCTRGRFEVHDKEVRFLRVIKQSSCVCEIDTQSSLWLIGVNSECIGSTFNVATFISSTVLLASAVLKQHNADVDLAKKQATALKIN